MSGKSALSELETHWSACGMCPAGPGSEPSRRPGERASLPKRAGGLLPIPREDPGPDSWAPQGGGERNPEAAAEAGDVEPSLCRHLERSADPAQLLFTAPAGVGWGGSMFSVRSSAAAHKQPGRGAGFFSPTPQGTQAQAQEGEVHSTGVSCGQPEDRVPLASPSPLPAAREATEEGQLGRRWSARGTWSRHGVLVASLVPPPPVTWCEHRRDRPQGGDGLLGLHDQNVPSWPQPRTGLSHTHESRRDPLSCLWRAPPHLPLRLGANMVLHKH